MSVLGILGQASALPNLLAQNLANPYLHAHELIFGFAFPIISGYPLDALEPRRLLELIGC